MSNVVAGIGRGQLIHLEEHRDRKEEIYRRYENAFAENSEEKTGSKYFILHTGSIFSKVLRYLIGWYIIQLRDFAQSLLISLSR